MVEQFPKSDQCIELSDMHVEMAFTGVENLEAAGTLGRAGTEFCKAALKFHMI